LAQFANIFAEVASLPLLGIIVHDSFYVVLGWWLILCGISLFFMARWEHKRTWSQRRATTDDTLRAEAYERRIKAHERGDGSGKKKDGAGLCRPEAGENMVCLLALL
jgi:hypothetical protein